MPHQEYTECRRENLQKLERTFRTQLCLDIWLLLDWRGDTGPVWNWHVLDRCFMIRREAAIDHEILESFVLLSPCLLKPGIEFGCRLGQVLDRESPPVHIDGLGRTSLQVYALEGVDILAIFATTVTVRATQRKV